MSVAKTTKRHFELREVESVVIAMPTDKRIIEDAGIQAAGAELFQLVESGRTKIIISFSDTEFISAAFLGKLITLHYKTLAHRGKLVLCEIRREIYEIFAITRLNKLICITDTLEQALAEF